MNIPTLISRTSPFPFLGVLGSDFSYFFLQILIEHSVSKQRRSDRTPDYAVSDLGLQCLPMSHVKDARVIWVK